MQASPPTDCALMGLVIAAYHAWLPEDATEARCQGAALNPELQRSKQGAIRGMTHTAADAPRPSAKYDAFMRDAACQGDASCRRGLSRQHADHTYKSTGLLASHPFMKVVYWDEAAMRNVDPMHTIGNELKALCEMAMGGTGKVPAYNVSRLHQLAKYECEVNNRWHDILSPYLQGKLQNPAGACPCRGSFSALCAHMRTSVAYTAYVLHNELHNTFAIHAMMDASSVGLHPLQSW